MKPLHSKLPFLIMMLAGICLFITSIWDIYNDQTWLQTIVALYGIIVILTIVLLFIGVKQTPFTMNNIKEFEKSLEGKLHHFQCPNCNGLFAIKKSKRNNKQSFSLTCPDCGIVGTIPAHPQVIEATIPEKKSMKTKFQCITCGEWISLWAEGAELFHSIQIQSCPYCGNEQAMRSI